LSRTTELFHTGVKAVCATFIAICMIAAFYSLGPRLETEWWPVVGKLKINSMETPRPGWTLIRVNFEKLRDCEYVGLSWYVGQRPDNFERIAVSVQRDPEDTGSPNRPLGLQRAGPWLVAVDTKEFTRGTFAQLQHRCHPFWISTTDFYP